MSATIRRGTRGQGAENGDSTALDSATDDGSLGVSDNRGHVNVGLEPSGALDSNGQALPSAGFGDVFGDDDEHAFGVRAASSDLGEPGVDLSPWAPLLGLLDATESAESPDDRPFAPSEGAEGPHALEMRAESMLLYAERGAQRTGALDRTVVGLSDDNRDIVAGRDAVGRGRVRLIRSRERSRTVVGNGR